MKNQNSKFGVIVDHKNGYGINRNQDKHLCGLVDEKDNLVIPFKYRNISFVEHDLILVENQDGIYAYFDCQGNEVIPFSKGYNFARELSEGLAVVGKYTRLPSDEDRDYEDLGIFDSHSYEHYDKRPKVFGYIDKHGNEVIPLQYQDAKHFCEGLAAVKDSNNKWGFIDYTGKVVISFEYDNICSTYEPRHEGFNEGTVLVRKDNLYGTINKENIAVIPIEHDEVILLDINKAIALMKGNKWGAYSRDGKIVVPFHYPEPDEGLIQLIEGVMSKKVTCLPTMGLDKLTIGL